jgi:hypothetical protein
MLISVQGRPKRLSIVLICSIFNANGSLAIARVANAEWTVDRHVGRAMSSHSKIDPDSRYAVPWEVAHAGR